MTFRKPDFITFTGADDHTDVEAMIALSESYPIEWGVLFSPSRQGDDPRYPGDEAQRRLIRSGLKLAAHLCGGHSAAIMEGEQVSVPVDLGSFERIQVNHSKPHTGRISEFHREAGPRCIAQLRDMRFPEDTRIDWLFDPSGGKGSAPPAWPAYPTKQRLVGYAGGINPGNVLATVTAIDAKGPYWIDMESGVRTDDRFDLALCRQVCEAVYG